MSDNTHTNDNPSANGSELLRPSCSQGCYILAEWDGEAFEFSDSMRFLTFEAGLSAIRAMGKDFYLLEVSSGSSHLEDGCERTLRVVANYDSANANVKDEANE
jgi:hypothetical protein